MANPIKKVDDFFSLIIEEEAGRFFCLHLPFWAFVIFVTWNVTEAIGLYLIWGGIVFAVTPFAVAVVFHAILESEKYNEKKTAFRVLIGVYAAAILALIGVPGLYLGLVFNIVRTQTFSDAYWTVIVGWYRFFHFYHEFKGTKAEIKAGQDFINEYQFSFFTWQVSFLVSAVVIAPLMFWWFGKKERDREWALEMENARLKQEARAAKEQEEAARRFQEEQQRKFEERQRQEKLAEEEKQKKIQEKINEVKGKDPWDSGFL